MMALVIAVVMCMAMAIPAMAASITINANDNNTPNDGSAETYHYYKIFSATVPSGHEITDDNVESDISGTATGFTYTLSGTSDKWYAAVNACGYFDLSTQSDGTIIATLKESYDANSTTAQGIASALAAYTVDKGGSIAKDGDITLGAASSVDDGYYLIISSLGEKLIVATTDVTITEKNEYPHVDKTEKDEDDADYVGVGIGSTDTSDVAVGDTIDYQVTVTVPATADKTITVADTMSDGLTFDDSDMSTALTATIDGTAYTGFTVTAHSAQGWTVTIPADTTTKGKDIVFSFSATVNSDAITDTDKENEVTLTYSNFEQTDSVPYEMVNAGIHKYDGNTNDDLEGVKFELRIGSTKVPVAYNSTDNYYYPDENGDADITTDSEGKVVIRGLDNDKAYVLHETDPLPGYNTLAADVTLTKTVDANGATDPTFVEVENNKGTELPSTGGIGTTIFYIIGAILVVGAGVILVTRRRMNYEK